METLFVPNEADFKRWIKEAVQECLQTATTVHNESVDTDGGLIDRETAAGLLKISLVTLTDWVKRGLPCHKQRGRVYFVKTEVLEYITKKGF